jgi:hypothetical protein
MFISSIPEITVFDLLWGAHGDPAGPAGESCLGRPGHGQQSEPSPLPAKSQRFQAWRKAAACGVRRWTGRRKALAAITATTVAAALHETAVTKVVTAKQHGMHTEANKQNGAFMRPLILLPALDLDRLTHRLDRSAAQAA